MVVPQNARELATFPIGSKEGKACERPDAAIFGRTRRAWKQPRRVVYDFVAAARRTRQAFADATTLKSTDKSAGEGSERRRFRR